MEFAGADEAEQDFIARMVHLLRHCFPWLPDDPLAFDEGNGSWFGYGLMADALPLTLLISHGVSSCCAGVTFPNVNDPDTIILTPVNNYIDQPIQAARRQPRQPRPA